MCIYVLQEGLAADSKKAAVIAIVVPEKIFLVFTHVQHVTAIQLEVGPAQGAYVGTSSFRLDQSMPLFNVSGQSVSVRGTERAFGTLV